MERDIQQAVISMVVALQHLAPVQVLRILQSLMQDPDQFHLSQVSNLVQQASPTQFRYLVSTCMQVNMTSAEELASQAEFLGQLSPVQYSSFGIIFQLCKLQEIFHRYFSYDQLLKVLEIIPPTVVEKQLELLQLLQVLLIEVMPNTLVDLQDEVQSNNQMSIAQMLDLEPHNPVIMVCDPLRALLTAPQDDLLQIRAALCALDAHQLALLVHLTQIDPFEVMELGQLLSPNHRVGALGLQPLEDPMNQESYVSQRTERERERERERDADTNTCCCCC
jgi:hypothetical protein